MPKPRIELGIWKNQVSSWSMESCRAAISYLRIDGSWTVNSIQWYKCDALPLRHSGYFVHKFGFLKICNYKKVGRGRNHTPATPSLAT